LFNKNKDYHAVYFSGKHRKFLDPIIGKDGVVGSIPIGSTSFSNNIMHLESDKTVNKMGRVL